MSVQNAKKRMIIGDGQRRGCSLAGRKERKIVHGLRGGKRIITPQKRNESKKERKTSMVSESGGEVELSGSWKKG